MRRFFLFVTLALLVFPSAAQAQFRLLAGGGLSSPTGDFGDQAETGFHGRLGIQLSVPAAPIALRADGEFHRFGETTILTETVKTNMLGGSVSAVVTLPGVGISPYLLGGAGLYRTTTDLAGVTGEEAVSDPGFHGGFGVNIGAIGFGGFGEVRIISISADGGSSRFLTATVGLRL